MSIDIILKLIGILIIAGALLYPFLKVISNKEEDKIIIKQHMRLEFRKQILRSAIKDYYNQVESPIDDALRLDIIKPRKIYNLPGSVNWISKDAKNGGSVDKYINDHDKYFIDEVNKYVSSNSGSLADIMKIKDPVNRGEKLVYFLFDKIHG